jgi:ABC-2 type transport system ATP-binding protein
LSPAGPSISAVGVSRRFLVDRRRPDTSHRRWPHRHGTIRQELWALRDVTLQVSEGETVGLLGANGSGKSTLLGLVAGILPPTTGQVRVRGRVGSLLELGAGFNGELSGRDNVFLNASLLGLPRREITRRFDAIVAFAELGPFIDTQVKHYSSGMYVRLGFAVAVHADPDVLLVDEVLAVGDGAYQRKCLAKVAELQARGRTILFVTHALDLVPRICQRAVVLDHGRIVHDGDPAGGAAVLRRLLSDGPDADDHDGPRVGGIRVLDPTTREARTAFRRGDPLSIEVLVTGVPGPVAADVDVEVGVLGPADLLVLACGPARAANGAVRFTVASLPALRGAFDVTATLRDPRTGATWDTHRCREAFQVDGAGEGGILQVPWSTAVPRGPSSTSPDGADGQTAEMRTRCASSDTTASA